MFSLSKTALILSLAAFSGAAFAANKVDLVAESISFAKGLDDDVSGNQSLHVALIIKNVGNYRWQNPDLVMRVLVDGAVFTGNIYGPNGSGGYNLGAQILPGQQGLVMFSAPLGSLANCQRRSIQIDADRTNQYGGDVFSNDTKTMQLKDRGAFRICPLPRSPVRR